MHLLRLLERWAGPEPRLDRRQTTVRTTALPATTNNPLTIISSILNPTTNPAPTTDDAPTPEPTTTPRTTNVPQTTNAPQTTTNRVTQQTSTPSSQPTTRPQSSSSRPSQITTVITPTDDSAPITTSIDDLTDVASATATSSKGRGSSGGFDGVKSKDIAVGVGVVVGVVGGFAIIVIGIYMWRRHQRRRQMERIGSMEELPRPPSPGPLSRSFTRGHGPRQPIDDDDDDFLTPMDTLPNTHRMDDWDSSKSPPNDVAHFDDKSVYAESIYQNDDQEPSLPPLFPVAPPAATTAANGRYYSGEYSTMRPKTPQSGGLGSSSSGTIPTYSAMNKYTAYTPGAAVTTPVGAAITTNTPTPPGGGYRSYDSHDAGGYV